MRCVQASLPPRKGLYYGRSVLVERRADLDPLDDARAALTSAIEEKYYPQNENSGCEQDVMPSYSSTV